MGEGTSIVNFGDLSRPATVLIQKISAAVGGVFKPHQIKRLAKAEAEAALIHAESEIKITDLHRRAMHRFVEEEAKKQENIEAITEKALPELEDKSEPQRMDDDWISNFFDKCRIVSDGEMQQLWSKVLAGEANAPGTFSKRTVNFIASLDKEDAILFSKFCGFGWMFGDRLTALIFDSDAPIYAGAGIHFESLSHLDDIGLISFNSITTFQQTRLGKRLLLYYYGAFVLLELPDDQNNRLNLGHVLLTKAGQQLARISGSTPVADFPEYVLARWSAEHYAPASPYPRREVPSA